MRFYIFANTAVKIVTGLIAALTFFALAAGQSAHAGNLTTELEPAAVQSQSVDDERFSRAIELARQLEQNFVLASAQMQEIELGYEAGEFNEEDLFIATVSYFNIESALIDARAHLIAIANDMQSEQTQFALTQHKSN
jgi:hypothetical protein